MIKLIASGGFAFGAKGEAWRKQMRTLLIAALFVIIPGLGPASAADGCGPGCHSTPGGACVVDGWGTGAPVWNECPAGARPVLPVLLGTPGTGICEPASRDDLAAGASPSFTPQQVFLVGATSPAGVAFPER
jgi:hypothetical protein